MNPQEAIRAALTQGLITANTGVDYAYENVKFNPASKTIWGEVVLMMNPAVPVSFEEDEVRGTLAINLSVPIGTGTKLAGEKAAALKTFFKIGKSLTHETTSVTIDSAGIKTGIQEGTSYILPFLATFYARTPRT